VEQGWAVVVGMTIAYAASLLGMLCAFLGYRRLRKRSGGKK
jgi:uncharacterized membrane protein YdjX (TVP38/TMEM64 family)